MCKLSGRFFLFLAGNNFQTKIHRRRKNHINMNFSSDFGYILENTFWQKMALQPTPGAENPAIEIPGTRGIRISHSRTRFLAQTRPKLVRTSLLCQKNTSQTTVRAHLLPKFYCTLPLPFGSPLGAQNLPKQGQTKTSKFHKKFMFMCFFSS